MTRSNPVPIRSRARPWTARAWTAGAVLLALTAAALISPTTAQAGPAAGLRSTSLYRSPDPEAARSLRALRAKSPASARLLAKSAGQPQAVWLGDWIGVRRVRSQVASTTALAGRQGTVPVLVVYDIPIRDCSSYAGGGARSGAQYRAFVDQVARGIGSRRAAVILEPDALAHISCLSAAGQRARIGLIAWAVRRLSSQPRAAVYLDAGHRYWQSPETMATRLRAAGIARARGFALNVANFDGTASEIGYGHRISALVGGKPFVVDTGRNGRGAYRGANAWCNPPGRGLGDRPTTRHRDPKVDALLWIKKVGESDGSCRAGAPSAGQWYLRYVLGLGARARW